MKKQLTLHIPQPCREQWKNMAERTEGRYCTSCAKTVIDFSALTDKEIFEYFRDPKEHVCGKLYNSQLNRVFSEREKNKQPLWKRMAALFTGFFIYQAAQAQTNTSTQIQTIIPVNIPYSDTKEQIATDTVETSKADTHVLPETINGKVVDAQTGEALIGATVYFQNTNVGAIADIDGNFTISTSEISGYGDSTNLCVSYVGYSTTVIDIRSLKTDSVVEINMEFRTDFALLGALEYNYDYPATFWQKATRPLLRWQYSFVRFIRMNK